MECGGWRGSLRQPPLAPACGRSRKGAEPEGGGAERQRLPGQAQGTRGEDLEALLRSSHPDVQWRWRRLA